MGVYKLCYLILKTWKSQLLSLWFLGEVLRRYITRGTPLVFHDAKKTLKEQLSTFTSSKCLYMCVITEDMSH